MSPPKFYEFWFSAFNEIQIEGHFHHLTLLVPFKQLYELSIWTIFQAATLQSEKNMRILYFFQDKHALGIKISFLAAKHILLGHKQKYGSDKSSSCKDQQFTSDEVILFDLFFFFLASNILFSVFQEFMCRDDEFLYT